MKRTAIFGGAFDPPHAGHLSNVSALLNSGLTDEVWFVPSTDVRDKPATVSAQHRLKMLEILIAENFADDKAVRLELCQIQSKTPGSYTVDLVAQLRSAHADREFYFVIGSELIMDLPKWKEPERLRKEVNFLVVPRPGYSTSDEGNFKLAVVAEKYLLPCGASSTTIRRLLREKKRTAGFLTPAVLSYINVNQLYV